MAQPAIAVLSIVGCGIVPRDIAADGSPAQSQCGMMPDIIVTRCWRPMVVAPGIAACYIAHPVMAYPDMVTVLDCRLIPREVFN